MYKKSYKSKYAKVLVMAFNRSIATEIREKIKNITKYGTFKPSPYQQTMIDFVAKGQGNGIVQAVAGSGKTTTIMQSLDKLRQMYGNTKAWTMFAGGVQYGNITYFADTSHAVFLRIAKMSHKFQVLDSKVMLIIRGGNKTLKVGKGKWEKTVIVEPLHNGIMPTIKQKVYDAVVSVYGYMSDEEMKKTTTSVENLVIRNIVKLVGIMKNTGTGFFADKPNDIRTVTQLYKYYGIAPFIQDDKMAECYAKLVEDNTLFLIAMKTLEESNKLIKYWDMDDFMYLTAYLQVPFPQKYQMDYIFVDECQDTNLITQYLIKKLAKSKTGRVMAVGDVSQAIYMFRGADAQAMQAFKTSFNATEIPLSLCYRCGKQIIKTTNEIYNKMTQSNPYTQIQALDTAPRGIVNHLAVAIDEMDHEQLKDLFNENTGVVCRKNAPLLSLARKLFLSQIPVTFLGKSEIGGKFASKMAKMKSYFKKGEYTYDNGATVQFPSGYKHQSVDMFKEYLEIYKSFMTKQLDAYGTKSDHDEYDDEISAYNLVLSLIEKKNLSLTNENIKKVLDELFTEEQQAGSTTLCSVHRSKGLEFHRVLILDFTDSFIPQFVNETHMYEQECNMVYVAYTRAERELIFIKSSNQVKKKKK
jgi:DNA helicase-2/ATP-dependent DNA helicase PcrA